MEGFAGGLESHLSASRIGVRDMLSYQSLMAAGAGTPRYEKLELWLGAANWHRGFCHAPPPPQRGTSPSPREVFDRTTFPPPHSWIPAPYRGTGPALRRNHHGFVKTA